MESIKVLIPTDFSVQAEYAYVMVQKLSRRVPMDIHFLHVLNMPDTVTLEADGTISTCGEIDVRYVETQKNIAERKLEEYKTQYGSSMNIHLRFGKTTEGILEFARSGKFDLIAMGTKGAWGLQERISGSEAQVVARKSTIPVLTLMCDRSDLEIRNVLLVHKFTDHTTQDISLLKKLTQAFQPNLHFLQIQKHPDQEEAVRIETEMKQFAESNELNNVSVHVIAAQDIEKGVVHFNQMNDMDLICIGTYGKGGLFYNSATERLINHMYKPIISFHVN